MRAEELAGALRAVRSGRQWKCRCVAHEDSSPSMIIFDGRESVQVRCMAGCEPHDIIAVLRSRGLWDGESGGEIVPKVVRYHDPDPREHRMRVLARCVFDGAVALNGTLAERYFESRELWSVARFIDDIRFHAECPREKAVQPAVVIAMRSIESNAVVAIQRIFLTRQARKDGAMMLASTGGAAMKLQPLQNGELHVAEGLETGLAVIAMDYQPVWSLGSASLIQAFEVIENVNDLTIWSDLDYLADAKKVISPGILAAEQCCIRWREAGRVCRILKSENLHEDAADVWSNRLARL